MSALGIFALILAAGAGLAAGIWLVTWRLDVVENCPPGEIAKSERMALLWSASAVALACLAWGLA